MMGFILQAPFEPGELCPTFAEAMQDPDFEAARGLQTVRMVKLLRMLKLARVFKASRVLERFLQDTLMVKLECTYAILKIWQVRS